MAASLIASVFTKGLVDGITTGNIDTSGATFLVMAIAYYSGGTFISVSDSKSNTWSGLTLYSSLGDPAVRLYYAANPTVGASHNFTIAGSSLYGSIAAMAFSGVPTVSPWDSQENGTNVSGASSIQPGSITPAQNNSLIVSMVGIEPAGSNPTINSGFTQPGSVNGVAAEGYGISMAYLNQGGAAAINPTWSYTGSTNAGSAQASFKTLSIASRLALLGAG